MCFVFLIVFKSSVNIVPRSLVSLTYSKCSPFGVATKGSKSVFIAGDSIEKNDPIIYVKFISPLKSNEKAIKSYDNP